MKDNNGDPGSPINDAIKGLFFGVNVDKNTCDPRAFSPFGDRRLHIRATVMMEAFDNLYFTDFYCNRKVHYVTLVLTMEGSVEDRFCSKNLLKLDPYKNSFLHFDVDEDEVYVTENIMVEVLVTEDVDIKSLQQEGHAAFSQMKSTGTSRPGGIPKNPGCRTCNLYENNNLAEAMQLFTNLVNEVSAQAVNALANQLTPSDFRNNGYW